MSLKCSAWAWKQRGLSPRAKLVLLALSDHVNQRDRITCYPGIDALMEETEIPERTLQRAITELEQRDLIAAFAVFTKRLGQRASRYVLNVDGLPADRWPTEALSWAQQAEPGARLVNRRDLTANWAPPEQRQTQLPGFRKPRPPRRPGTPPVPNFGTP